MPTPVSCFSPFTPFTPSSNGQGSGGGYFDRPTPSFRNAPSSLSRRPDLCSHNFSSSSSTRISRVSAPINSQLAENGWGTASRLREEALSAWEQQVRSNTNINHITTLRPPSQYSGNPTQVLSQCTGEASSNKPRSTSSDRAKHGSQSSRPSLRLSFHIQQALRKTHSENLIEQAAFSKLSNTSRFFDRPSASGTSTKHQVNVQRVQINTTSDSVN